MISAWRARRGYVLLPVAITVALIATLAFLLSRESTQEVRQVGAEIESAAADYVTQAGLQHALQDTARQGCGPYTDPPGGSLGADQYSAVLTTNIGTTETYPALPVDQDTHIKEDKPTENKAGDGRIHIQSDFENKTEIALLRYDLSQVSANVPILSATGWFYLERQETSGQIDIHRITSDWTDTDATWLSMSTNFETEALTSIPPQAGPGVWVPVNLTNQVQAWVNGEENFGIALTSSADGVHEQYSSMNGGNSPYLDVVVGTPASTLAQLSVTGTNANELSKTITRDDITLRQYPAQTIQRRLDSGSGRDTSLSSLLSSSNFGIRQLVLVAGPTETALLLRFDLPAIPPGARIVSAKLELYHYRSVQFRSGSGAEVYRVTRDWIEGTRNGAGTADGATWDTWDGSADWTNAGGDYQPTPVADSEISEAIDDWESWEIASLVQGWVDEDFPNHGLLLKAKGNLWVAFSSREDAVAEQRPRLTVRYACVCGESCALPRGSGSVLMVVPNDSNPADVDLRRRGLLESWGYSVNLVDQNANKATFDAAIANSDVVLISENVSANNAANRVLDAPIGVIVLGNRRNYVSDLGIASNTSWKIDTGLEITDNSHYITRLFGVGEVKIFNAGMEQMAASGVLSASSRTLAENDSDPGLVVIEAGGLLESGGNAAGRRVMLPIGRQGSFNWAALNANGRLLMQRALEWGTGNLPATSTGNLLMVVSDPGSLNAQERAKQLLFESWGFTVNLIDESAAQTAFDNALADNDAVFVSEDVNPGNLGGKLLGTSRGVVVEAVDLFDDFGFATGLSSNSDTALVTANTHYITLDLGNGSSTILTRNEPLAGLTAPLAPDLEVIGISAAGSSLATLDADDRILDNGRAAGRRVALPWGDGNFNINHLNSNGLEVLQRSLEWAAGADAPPMALLVTADSANLTPREADLKTQFESWEYIVYLADDDDIQTDLLSLANALDVVYVPGSISLAALGSKLDGTSTGVVSEAGGLLDNFGFSDGAGIAVLGDQFDQTSVSHYVSEPFAGGAVAHFTDDVSMPRIGGTLAPDLTSIASIGSDWVLTSLDKDARRWDNTPSPGRRIHLPFANASLSQLTADGQTLLERSLDWASGAEGAPSILAHWKLDETSGAVAEDSIGWNDATQSGSPQWVEGTLDGALEFDGGNDYVTTANNFRPPPTGSVAFWMKVPEAPSSEGQVLGLDDAWEIRHVDNGFPGVVASALVFDLGVNGSNDEFVTTVAVDEPNRWYFVVATYDAESNAYQVHLDNTLNNSGVFSGGLSMPDSNLLSLGRRTGSNKDFEGTLDDVRIYNYVLSEEEIKVMYVAGTPNAKRYFELDESFKADDEEEWEVYSLAAHGVPADAVVEVVLTNKKNKDYEAGVRAVGSPLQRRVDLHEAKGGGVEALTMHVQANENSEIEIYAEKKMEIIFVLAGYWTGSSYQETFQVFDEQVEGAWTAINLTDQGVGADQVVEVLMVNTNQSNQRRAGTRARATSRNRRFTLHEAKGGGIDGLSLMVTADAGSAIEVYSQDVDDVEFYVLGSWADPPGTYQEPVPGPLQVTSSSTWESLDLSVLGIPADSVVQFALANRKGNRENRTGVRRFGSSLDERWFELHEAEGGGADLVSLHVRLDEASAAEGLAEHEDADTLFYPAGWWELTPP